MEDRGKLEKEELQKGGGERTCVPKDPKKKAACIIVKGYSL